MQADDRSIPDRWRAGTAEVPGATAALCSRPRQASVGSSELLELKRKSEDTPDKKRRRMPFVAKIKRDDPFTAADTQEIYRMCRRIAAAAEHCSFAGWRENAGFLVYHFTTWAKARAMQHWIDRSGIAHRPMPKLGESAEEKAARESEVMEWALGTGAARDIVQAYRRRIFAGDGHISAMIAAYNVAADLGCQRDGLNDAVEHIIEWAQKNHAVWFHLCRPPEEDMPATAPAAPRATIAPAPVEAPATDPPRWRPSF